MADITQNGALKRDDNDSPVMGGTSSSDNATIINAAFNPVTRRLLTDSGGGGSGTVTDVSVVSANGFAGTVATSTTTPAITLTTTITGILKGNGTAISAAVAGTDYADLTFKTIAVSGQSDVVADTAADTLTLVAGSGMTITTNATTDTITFAASGGAATSITVGTTTVDSGTTTRILYDNAGVLGEYTITGSGTVVAMATAPTFVTSITTPSVLATANDSGALGASGTAFADLFLASGGVINWNAGDVTITHASNLLSFAGASTGYTFDAPVLLSTTTTPLTFLNAVASSGVTNFQVLGTTNATSALVLADFNATAAHSGHLVFYKSANAAIGSATVVANGDQLGQILFTGAQQTGTFATQNVAAMITGQVDGVVTSGAGADMPGRILFSTTPDGSGTPTDRLIIDSAGVFKPAANDGIALGTTALSFSDLFLASGAVINFNAGNYTITHSAGLLTTNGNLSLTTSGVLTTGTIELGAATDTTLSRSAAGVLAVEGVVIPSISSTNTLTNKRVTRRLTTTNAPGATPTTNTDNVDVMNFTGLATAITSMTTNLSGTPSDGDLLEFRFLDDGTARAITWGATFASTTVTMPTTTVISTCLRVGFEWRKASSKWECIATC